MTLSGRCLCEGVTYEIRGPVRGVVNCHCSRCRRHTGHFMAATQAAADDVVISGDGLTWYDATDEVQYGFCGTCGSTMFWRTAAHPDRISIAAGTLTPPTGLETIGTIYRNYASDYHVFDESVPNHGEDFPEVQMTATLSLDDLARDPHPILASLRSEAPVAWVESLDAWLVTSHQLCTEVMLDAETFTVDDPRFSTQQVIGPSMLSLDGAEHRRHRDPFAPPFRAAKMTELRQEIEEEASRLIEPVVADGGGDLRSRVAAPLAVSVMAGVLDLDDVAVADLLGWYEAIVSAVHEVTAGNPVPRSGLDAFDELKGAVSANLTSSRLLGPVDEEGSLDVDEIVSNVAVLLFGGVVTSESSTAIAFHHLLADPEIQTALRADSSAVKPFVEETFRIEPSAAAVDRYATRDVDLAGAAIAKGDLVRVSLSAANRDPAVFPDPDRLDWTRDNLGRSLTFARGPHACLGIHLARLETIVAIEKLLDTPGPLASPGLEPVEGLVFRVPISVEATWPGSDVSGG